MESSALAWHWLGRISHNVGIDRQRVLRDRLLAGDASAACLLLCEHDPIITLGRHADRSHILADPASLAQAGIEVVATKRGGEVTYHGPGQLMVYPVIRIRGQVVEFLAGLAQALAEVAADLGVPGAVWQRDPAGLWLPQDQGDDTGGAGNPTGVPAGVGAGAGTPAKLAACGIHLRRGALLHGFAFNVATPPARWALIRPCGLRLPVTSLAQQRAGRGLPPPPPIDEIARHAAPGLCAALTRYGSRT